MHKVKGTREAFTTIINQRGVYKKLDVDRSTVSNWRRAMEGIDDKNIPTLNKMEELLARYGASVIKEKVWKLP